MRSVIGLFIIAVSLASVLFGCAKENQGAYGSYIKDVDTFANEEMLSDPDYKAYDIQSQEHVITQQGVVSGNLTCNQFCTIMGTNRFNINTAQFSTHAYENKQTRTNVDNGIKVVCTSTDATNYLYQKTTYIAEITGKLWFSCDASAEGDVKDLGVKMSVVGREADLLYGEGRLAQCMDVEQGEEVTLIFYTHIGTEKGNTVYYKNIQLQYEVLTDYVQYTSNQRWPLTQNTSSDATPQAFFVPLAVGNILISKETFSLSYYGKKPVEEKYNVVCFGDSITGIFSYGADYPAMLNYTSKGEINAYNVGFSGCMWTDHPDGGYMPFSMNRLVDSILSKDYSLQEKAVSKLDAVYAERLATLKAIDFNEVDIVTVFYGTNDFGYNVPLTRADDSATRNRQRTNIEDSVQYCISKLQTEYPHLRFIVLSPYWRSVSNGKDSDIHANKNGDYLYEFSKKITEIANTMKNTSAINFYETVEISADNYRHYAYDGTHPTEKMKHIITDAILAEINRK